MAVTPRRRSPRYALPPQQHGRDTAAPIAALRPAASTAWPDEPISNVVWLDANSLNGNDYNPNVVFPPELVLLERSLMLTHWVQPVLLNKDGTIIDGFHRMMLSRESPALRKRYAGAVPCVVLDLPRDRAMILTIRMNRAKGTHVALRMSAIVRELVDVHHCDPQEIAIEIGATLDEVALLRQDGVFKHKNIDAYRFSKAWYPGETTRDKL